MATRRILAALLTTMTLSAAAFAQSAEFGRTSGGQLDVAMKSPSGFSGSLGLTTSRSSGLSRYGGTYGGTIVKDRMWFFGTTERNQVRYPSAALPQISQVASNVAAQIGSRSSLGASFGTGSSSFMSLRYTGIVSSNMFVTATVSGNSQRQ